MQSAMDGRTALLALLGEEESAYDALQECALALRRALLQGSLDEIRARVAEHQSHFTRIASLTRRAEELCCGEGLLDPGTEFTLRRLADALASSGDERLRERTDRLLGVVARAAREMAHNRYLIGRLSQWTEDELRLVLAPLYQSAGHLENGTHGRATPDEAVADRRG